MKKNTMQQLLLLCFSVLASAARLRPDELLHMKGRPGRPIQQGSAYVKGLDKESPRLHYAPSGQKLPAGATVAARAAYVDSADTLSNFGGCTKLRLGYPGTGRCMLTPTTPPWPFAAGKLRVVADDEAVDAELRYRAAGEWWLYVCLDGGVWNADGG